ncbi:hypothetical protein DSM3645_13840 [Blastopirellula marina DSM 3645]|uniref:Uncharacterized protein n=1 Tax=Blastopirellula marina DSM 3645 TaxID=314230 RepID=A3ZWS6_9BACT|nr:hypothetical protein DSM3645_13840 [Blastopirellula marina DSM 3645]
MPFHSYLIDSGVSCGGCLVFDGAEHAFGGQSRRAAKR